MHAHSHARHAGENFPTDTTDLELATDPETVEISDGSVSASPSTNVTSVAGPPLGVHDATVRWRVASGSMPFRPGEQTDVRTKVAAWRVKRGVTQHAMADAVGVSRATYVRLEQGRTANPPLR